MPASCPSTISACRAPGAPPTDATARTPTPTTCPACENPRRFPRGRPLRQPVFDPVAGQALDEIEIPACRILLADGEIAAHDAVRPWLDRLILVEAHWRTQLNTRLTRDLRERHCSLEKAIDLFLHSNLRDYPRFAAGARDAAHAVLYCNARRTFSVRRLPGHSSANSGRS
jgi:uridine kinase